MSTPEKNTTNDLPSSDRPSHNPEADEIVCDGYAPLLATACRYLTFLLFNSSPLDPDDVSGPVHLIRDFADASCAPGSNGEELLGMRQ